MKKKRFTIIGMTTFGCELARLLTRSGAEVTIIDLDEDVVQEMRDEVADARVADGRDIDALREIGVDQADRVIVATRSHFEMTVLVVHAAQTLGVPSIVALASSGEQASVLEKLGVQSVVFPERDAAMRWAQLILHPSLHGYLELADGYGMIEIDTPEKWVGKTLAEAEVRRTHEVNIVAIREAGDEQVRPFVPNPDYTFKTGDALILVGPDVKLKAITRTTP